MPRDPYEKIRWEMAGVHQFLLDGLHNMYILAETIPTREEQNFGFYCYCAIQNIFHHHHLEETYIFPKLEPEFKTDVLSEHAAFHKALEDINTYILEVLGVDAGKTYGQTVPAPHKQKVPYDGKKLKTYLEALAGPLLTHLQHEIGWLEPEKIRASGVPAERFAEIDANIQRQLKTSYDPHTVFVWAYGHVAPYSYFPDLPWFLVKVLLPWVWYWRHRASWKFFPDYSKSPFGPLQDIIGA